MQRIPDGSVDCIICDLPYGYIESKWDIQIPFDKLWEQYRRIIKTGGVIALFGNEPFASNIRLSNVEWYRYDWYWHKTKFANYALAPYMPLRDIETISIFSQGTIAPNSKIKMTYNPQGLVECHIDIHDKPCDKAFRPGRKPTSYTQRNTNYPRQLLKYANDTDGYHPTQKPIELVRYLVRTYSNPGDTILDNTIGSGTTAVAALREKRHFIGFELNRDYYDIALRRIKLEQQQQTLF